jgi:hypothetical protein
MSKPCFHGVIISSFFYTIQEMGFPDAWASVTQQRNGASTLVGGGYGKRGGNSGSDGVGSPQRGGRRGGGADTALSAHEGGIGSAPDIAHTHTIRTGRHATHSAPQSPPDRSFSVETFVEAGKVVQVELNKRD